MIDGVIINKLDKFDDQRGWLAEFFRNDETEYQAAMGYISMTLNGVVRGPHEHLKQSDFFVFISGKFKIYFWDNRQGAKNYRILEVFEIDGNSPCSVIVPPGVVHGYKCISKEPGLIVNLPDALYKGKGKKDEVDEVRWENDENSPFKIND